MIFVFSTPGAATAALLAKFLTFPRERQGREGCATTTTTTASVCQCSNQGFIVSVSREHIFASPLYRCFAFIPAALETSWMVASTALSFFGVLARRPLLAVCTQSGSGQPVSLRFLGLSASAATAAVLWPQKILLPSSLVHDWWRKKGSADCGNITAGCGKWK